jgi:putative DNA primase/helicase
MPDDSPVIPFRLVSSDWIGRLAKNEKGGYLPTLANAMVILRNDPAVSDLVALNLFTGEQVVLRAPPPIEDGAPLLHGPYPRCWQHADISQILGYLQRVWSSRFSAQTVEQAMVATAPGNAFHPVRDWLATLKWDGKDRVDTWLHKAFGTPNDAYHTAVGRKFLVAAVRRILHPGCKFDSLLVLEGPQNIGKSRSCQQLVGAKWFSDALPHDLGSRDAALGLMGKWLIELGELDSLVRTEVETVKAFLSRETDRYRAPYGKNFEERPRQGVLVGTTNQTDYLRDSTGNRRFWPVRCEKAEHAWIAEVRDQLWAEAVQIEADGETLWLDEDGISTAAKRKQSDRLAEDPWAWQIRDWISMGSRTEVRSIDVLKHGLNLEAPQQTRQAEMRVASVLRADGWVSHVHRPKNATVTVRSWFAPGSLLPGGKQVPYLEQAVDIATGVVT